MGHKVDHLFISYTSLLSAENHCSVNCETKNISIQGAHLSKHML
uniref:Uncharacterized protein n=1 Tax=Rhizophora mucronata TaxID=61149 RepID=A0A2P2J3H4_RHIMU